MLRFWWPGPLYEARPYGALAIGIVAGLGSLVRAMQLGEWRLAVGAAFVAGCIVMIYGGVVVQMRIEYRRRSRWYREKHRHDRLVS